MTSEKEVVKHSSFQLLSCKNCLKRPSRHKSWFLVNKWTTSVYCRCQELYIGILF